MRVLGYTGTRNGLTDKQMDAIGEWFYCENLVAPFGKFLHGCAIGADCWMTLFVKKQGNVPIFAYPSNSKRHTSSDAMRASDMVFNPSDPLKRNKDIVQYCDVLLACPADMHEELRSGTWATIRHARKEGRHIVIVWPDGSFTEERAA